MQRTYVMIAALAAATALSGVANAQGDQGRGRGRGQDQKEQQQQPADRQKRMQDEQRRADDYRKHLDGQVRQVQQQSAQLEQARRPAQSRVQQEYAAQLARQQEQMRAERRYDNDSYVVAAPTFRYRYGSVSRETNQDGVDLLRQAVNDGYRRGYQAGVADREDHWRSDYADSPAYREGTFGYTGSYVDLDDYQYYFRQGFQRGYEDGYNSRFRYGSSSNGAVSILANVLSGILHLSSLH